MPVGSGCEDEPINLGQALGENLREGGAGVWGWWRVTKEKSGIRREKLGALLAWHEGLDKIHFYEFTVLKRKLWRK